MRKEYLHLRVGKDRRELYLEFSDIKKEGRGYVKLNKKGSYPTSEPFEIKGGNIFKLYMAEICGEAYCKVGKKA